MESRSDMRLLFCFTLCLSLLELCRAQDQLPTVQTEGGLRFASDSRGNRLPDYAYCGYRASDEPLPDVPTRLLIEPSGEDDTQRLQAALEELSSMPADPNGWHGALELAPGEFSVSGSIALESDGIVSSRDAKRTWRATDNDPCYGYFAPLASDDW